MAKTAPPKPSALHGKAKRMARIRGDLHPLTPQKIHRAGATVTDGFIDSKKDRRTMKRSIFVNKIKKSHPASAATSRRRGGAKDKNKKKQLLATLESLADALPDVDEADRPNEGKTRHRSLASRPGALKRKEKVVRGEMERFGENMAKLVGAGAARAKGKAKGNARRPRPVGGGGGEGQQSQPTPQATSTESRWAALRGFISMTMEQNPAFIEKEKA